MTCDISCFFMEALHSLVCKKEGGAGGSHYLDVLLSEYGKQMRCSFSRFFGGRGCAYPHGVMAAASRQPIG